MNARVDIAVDAGQTSRTFNKDATMNDKSIPANNIGIWLGLATHPVEDGIYIARKKNGDRICIERRGGAWQDHDEAYQWFCTQDDILQMNGPPLPDQRALLANEHFLDRVSDAELRAMTIRPPSPADQEFAATTALARRELSLLNVEVVRVYRVAKNAFGPVTGKTLSISENFAAQATDDGAVVIHDMARLSHSDPNGRLLPGDEITVIYEGGHGVVHNGTMECFGLRISSKGMDAGEVDFVRDRIAAVLSERAQWIEIDQAQLSDVAIAVCHEAKEKFGWPGIPRSLVVSKYDVIADQLQTAVRHADARAARLADENGFEPPAPSDSPQPQHAPRAR